MEIVFAGPVSTRSGYGARARDVCHALIELGHNLRIVSTVWGGTPTDALKADNPRDMELIKRINNAPLSHKPEVFIHCTIPNEFQAAGLFNIGLTAGIETDICRVEWIEGCNKMNLVLTSSEHSKAVFEKTNFQKRDQRTGQVVGEVKCTTPVRVLMEGVNTEVYGEILPEDIDPDINSWFHEVDESFAFLFVGHWMQGDLGQDRKDVGKMIETFLTTFASNKKGDQPALILKTGVVFSVPERFRIQSRIQDLYVRVSKSLGIPEAKLPKVYLLWGDFTDQEINSVYNHPKVKAMLSFTKGEGFGRPLLEFTTTGKPVITSNWSGPVDFMHPEHSFLLPGQLTQVHPSAANEWILLEGKWFTVDYSVARQVLVDVYTRYNDLLKRTQPHAQITKTRFSMEQMTKDLDAVLNNLRDLAQAGQTPVEQKLVLPTRKNKS